MLEGMRTQYSILADLKRIDEKVSRVQRDLERIPEQVSKLESTLAAKRTEFEHAKGNFDAHEKTLRNSESDLREKEDFLKKAESKMMEVKTNAEYQAAMKENEGTKSEKAKIEEVILKSMGQLETERATFKEAEKAFKDFEGLTKKECDTLNEDKLKLEAQFQELVGKRNSVSTQLTPEIASLYNRISSRGRSTGAVVQVENGMCLGCNIKVRPQLYNEILGFKTIHQCPSCGRILIIISTETDPTTHTNRVTG